MVERIRDLRVYALGKRWYGRTRSAVLWWAERRGGLELVLSEYSGEVYWGSIWL